MKMLNTQIISKAIYLIFNSEFRKYFKNSSILILEKIFKLISSLIIGVWLARYLGANSFGIYSFVISFVSLFSIIATFGIDGIIIKEFSDTEDTDEYILGTIRFMRFIFSSVAILFVNIVNFLYIENTQTQFFTLIYSFSIYYHSISFLELYFQIKFKSQYILYVNILTLIISSLMKAFLIIFKYPLIYFFYNLIFESLILGIGFIYVYHKKTNLGKKWRFDKNLFKKFILNGWPLLLSSMVVSIYMKIDQIILEKLIGNEAVGKFSAAIKLTESWYFIPMVICSSLLPSIISVKKVSETLYYKRLSQIFNLLTIISIVVAVILTIYSDWIILFLYGKDYADSAQILTITAWTGIFVCFGIVSGYWLILENLQMLSFWRTIVGLFINIALNFILIPIYGIKGSAIATLVGQISSTFLFDLINPKTKIIFLLKLKSFSLFR